MSLAVSAGPGHGWFGWLCGVPQPTGAQMSHARAPPAVGVLAAIGLPIWHTQHPEPEDRDRDRDRNRDQDRDRGALGLVSSAQSHWAFWVQKVSFCGFHPNEHTQTHLLP